MKKKQKNLIYIYAMYIIKVVILLLSAVIQAFVIQSFIRPEQLIPGGFTGLSVLINLIFLKIGYNVPLSILLFVLNLPVAIICARTIGKKFVILSLIQIIATSVFLEIFHFKPIFHNSLLNIIIGAVIFGLQVTMALRSGGSTGGMDFIALFVSHKINRTIWEYIFMFNLLLLFIFGYISSWDNAGYSIIFQFIVTRTISTFYNRYHRITMQVITSKADEIIDAYIENYNHGITKIVGEGGYTKEVRYVCYTIVSVYEVNDIVKLFMKIDKDVIINTCKTEKFYGKFYIPDL